MLLSLITFFAIIVNAICALVYFYFTKNHTYWKKRGIVTAQPISWLGSYPGLFFSQTTFMQNLGGIYAKYRGQQRAVGVFMATCPQILVLDPQLANEVLVKNFSDYRDTVTSSYVTHSKNYDIYAARNPFFSAGDEWKKRRTDGGAGLTPNRLKQAYAIWEQTGNQLIDYIGRCQEKSASGVIETRDLCYRYTAQAMGDFIWGIDARSLTCDVNEISEFQRFSASWVSNAFHKITLFNASWVAPILRKWLRLRFFTHEANEFYLKLTRDAIRLRLSSGDNRSDFLSHLMQLQDKGSSVDDMVGHALTVLMDGFETSAAVLYHFLYTIAGFPEQQEKLRAELLEALANNKNMNYEQLNALPYLDQCVNESMRITSVIGFFIKICTRHTTMDLGNDKKLVVEPGVTVTIPAYHFHHDENYFPEPMQFKPERFDNGAASEFTKQGIFLPFGDGPRICMGMRTGLLNVKMAVLRIIADYKVERTNKLKYTADSGLGIYLDGDVNLKYTKVQ